jgi:hypothetical protein
VRLRRPGTRTASSCLSRGPYSITRTVAESDIASVIAAGLKTKKSGVARTFCIFCQSVCDCETTSTSTDDDKIIFVSQLDFTANDCRSSSNYPQHE